MFINYGRGVANSTAVVRVAWSWALFARIGIQNTLGTPLHTLTNQPVISSSAPVLISLATKWN